MERIKCLTFDKQAQDALPQHIKDKMKADREKAKKEQCMNEFKGTKRATKPSENNYLKLS